jgi:hypothetical protein
MCQAKARKIVRRTSRGGLAAMRARASAAHRPRIAAHRAA